MKENVSGCFFLNTVYFMLNCLKKDNRLRKAYFAIIMVAVTM